jgi:hypothetical protein
MGTCNFCVDNASEHFVVLDGDDIDQFDADCFVEDITNAISNISADWGYFPDADGRIIENEALRSYGRQYLGSDMGTCIDYAGVEIGFTTYAYLTSGYYDGATLDWTTDIHRDYESVDEAIDAAIEDAIYYGTTNAGLMAVHGKRLRAKVNAVIEANIEALETIYKQYSNHRLQRLGVMSNGEAIYSGGRLN